MPDKVLLKDQLFNQAKIDQIAKEIHHVHPPFKKAEFTATVLAEFPKLELKARISMIADCLKSYLPEDFRQAAQVLISALPAPCDPELSDNDFGDFIYAPYSEFVAQNGCTKKDLAFSLAALKEFTKRFSAEDAIRCFINAFPQETLKQLLEWSHDEHYHVRRLCSEGTRPKLPWAKKINIALDTPIPILDNLFSDKTRFVTRSVANHVNDISKTNPELVLGLLSRWQKSDRQATQEMDYIIRHSLRTLVKSGHPETLKFLGASPEVKVRVTEFQVPLTVKMNSPLNFSLTIQAEESAQVIADYVIFFQNQSGKMSGRKVFKLKKLKLNKSESAVISKSHVLRDDMTTRKLYHGHHEIELQINGKPFGRKSFQIV